MEKQGEFSSGRDAVSKTDQGLPLIVVQMRDSEEIQTEAVWAHGSGMEGILDWVTSGFHSVREQDREAVDCILRAWAASVLVPVGHQDEPVEDDEYVEG